MFGMPSPHSSSITSSTFSPYFALTSPDTYTPPPSTGGRGQGYQLSPTSLTSPSKTERNNSNSDSKIMSDAARARPMTAAARYNAAIWAPQLTVATSSYAQLERKRAKEIITWTPAMVALQLGACRAFYGLSMLVDAKSVHSYNNYVDLVRLRHEAANATQYYSAPPRTAEEEAERWNTSQLAVLKRELAEIRKVTNNSRSMHDAKEGEVEEARLEAARERERIEARGVPTEVIQLHAGPPVYVSTPGQPDRLVQRLPMGEALFLNNVDGSMLLGLTQNDLTAHFGLTETVARVTLRGIEELKAPMAEDRAPLPSSLKELLAEQRWDLHLASQDDHSGVPSNSTSVASSPRRERRASTSVYSHETAVHQGSPHSPNSTLRSPMSNRLPKDNSGAVISFSAESSVNAKSPASGHLGNSTRQRSQSINSNTNRPMALDASVLRNSAVAGCDSTNVEFKKWSSLSRAGQLARLEEQREEAIRLRQEEADAIAKVTEVDPAHLSPVELLEAAQGMGGDSTSALNRQTKTIGILERERRDGVLKQLHSTIKNYFLLANNVGNGNVGGSESQVGSEKGSMVVLPAHFDNNNFDEDRQNGSQLSPLASHRSTGESPRTGIRRSVVYPSLSFASATAPGSQLRPQSSQPVRSTGPVLVQPRPNSALHRIARVTFQGDEALLLGAPTSGLSRHPSDTVLSDDGIASEKDTSRGFGEQSGFGSEGFGSSEALLSPKRDESPQPKPLTIQWLIKNCIQPLLKIPDEECQPLAHTLSRSLQKEYVLLERAEAEHELDIATKAPKEQLALMTTYSGDFDTDRFVALTAEVEAANKVYRERIKVLQGDGIIEEEESDADVDVDSAFSAGRLRASARPFSATQHHRAKDKKILPSTTDMYAFQTALGAQAAEGNGTHPLNHSLTRDDLKGASAKRTTRPTSASPSSIASPNASPTMHSRKLLSSPLHRPHSASSVARKDLAIKILHAHHNNRKEQAIRERPELYTTGFLSAFGQSTTERGGWGASFNGGSPFASSRPHSAGGNTSTIEAKLLAKEYSFEDDFRLNAEAFAFATLEATMAVPNKEFDFLIEYISDRFGSSKVEELRRKNIISAVFADACEAYRPAATIAPAVKPSVVPQVSQASPFGAAPKPIGSKEMTRTSLAELVNSFLQLEHRSTSAAQGRLRDLGATSANHTTTNAASKLNAKSTFVAQDETDDCFLFTLSLATRNKVLRSQQQLISDERGTASVSRGTREPSHSQLRSSVAATEEGGSPFGSVRTTSIRMAASTEGGWSASRDPEGVEEAEQSDSQPVTPLPAPMGVLFASSQVPQHSSSSRLSATSRSSLAANVLRIPSPTGFARQRMTATNEQPTDSAQLMKRPISAESNGSRKRFSLSGALLSDRSGAPIVSMPPIIDQPTFIHFVSHEWLASNAEQFDQKVLLLRTCVMGRRMEEDRVTRLKAALLASQQVPTTAIFTDQPHSKEVESLEPVEQVTNLACKPKDVVSEAPASTSSILTQEGFEKLCAQTVVDPTEKPIVVLLAPERMRLPDGTYEKFSIYPAVLVEQFFWNAKNPALRRAEPDRFANNCYPALKQQQPKLFSIGSASSLGRAMDSIGPQGGMARGHWYYIEFGADGLNKHPLLGDEGTGRGAKWPPKKEAEEGRLYFSEDGGEDYEQEPSVASTHNRSRAVDEDSLASDVQGGLFESFLRQLSCLLMQQRKGGIHPSFRVFVRYPSSNLSGHNFPTIAHRTSTILDLANNIAVVKSDARLM